MTPDTKVDGRKYKLSFTINSVIGGVTLALAIVGFAIESTHPQVRGLGWGFLPATLICWFIASLHYAKYLSLQR